MQIAVIDIAFLLVMLILCVRGAIKGFVAEAGSMAALILGFGAAFALYKTIAVLIDRHFGQSMWNPLIAFLLLFLILYLVVKLVERLLRGVVERLNLDRLDRALGLFLGLAEGLLLVALMLFLLSWQPFFDSRGILGESLFARFLSPLLPSPERIFRVEPLLRNV